MTSAGIAQSIMNIDIPSIKGIYIKPSLQRPTSIIKDPYHHGHSLILLLSSQIKYGSVMNCYLQVHEQLLPIQLQVLEPRCTTPATTLPQLQSTVALLYIALRTSACAVMVQLPCIAGSLLYTNIYLLYCCINELVKLQQVDIIIALFSIHMKM